MAFDRYEIIEQIGSGVSARVYKALDKTTGAAVALKVLSPDLAADPVSVERFRREVRITRLLGHPQVVPVYDLVQEDGQTALVMELIEGDSLKQKIAGSRALPVNTAVGVLRQLLEVLAACHANHVVHRDLKPHNVMIDGSGNARVLDFGIAKMSTLADITQTGTAIGSPEYMAPELFAVNRFDPRTDLYAAGIITYEMLSGAPPFRGDSLAILYQQHATQPLPSLSAVRRDVPVWLEHIVERLTAKQPHARYQSADEALVDLKQRRVQARELPPLPRQVCLECGVDTPAELPLCLACGQEASLRLRAGDVDVRCEHDEDDAKLAGFLQSVVGVAFSQRRGRRLLFTALDGVSAERLVRRAGEHGLMLSATPHSSRVELRKAVALALLCFVSSWCGSTLGAAYAYYGSAVGAWAHEQSAPAWLMWSVAGVLLWLAARRVHDTEVEPVIELKGAALGAVQREVAWLKRIAPFLTVERSDETKAFVAELVEKHDRLVRFARDIDPATAHNLEQLVEQAAQLATLIGEIETGLQAPIFAERAQRYAFVENQLRVEQDPQERAALATRAASLREEVDAFCSLEEKSAALTGSLVAVHAFFNRLIGRLLVYHAPIDKESRERLTTYAQALRDDLAVSREVQADIARCR